ncbi:hypothetical protein FACS1894132_01790 [Clostridia bacterium]|nr:hypothetical protein FACS1894132_01790 [Clostridia bacterium]
MYERDRLVAEGYKLYKEVIDAKEVLSYKKIDVPPKINGYIASCSIKNKEELYVTLRERTVDKEFGVYNLLTKEYVKILDVDTHDVNTSKSVMSFDDDFLIVAEYTSFGSLYSNLYYYNLETKEYTLFFEHSTRDGRLCEPTYNEILFIDGVVYFDDYAFDENDDLVANLYSYNISKKELKLIKKYAQLPMLYKNEIVSVVLNDENKYNTIASLDDSFRFDFPSNLVGLKTNNQSIYGMSIVTNEEHRYSEWTILNLITDEKIMSSVSTVGNLLVSDSFLTWTNYLENNLPCVYDIKSDKILQFSDLEKGENTVGLIDDYGEVDIFGDYATNEIFVYLFEYK